MKAIQVVTSIAAACLALLIPSRADAQCRTIVVQGPGVRVVAPCLPPPPVVVRVVPAPPPPPVIPAPPPVAQPQQQPCVAPPPPPPPVRVVRRAPRPRIFTLGMFAEGTLFKDGGLGGAGFYAQFRVGRRLHLFTSLGANASCTNCNPNDPTRVDVKTTVGLQWYWLASRHWSPFLRGSLVYQSVRFRDSADPEVDVARANQFGGELAAGLELRLFRWLILSGDVAYIGLKRVGEENVDGPLPAGAHKGLATVNEFDHGATFRLNLAIRF